MSIELKDKLYTSTQVAEILGVSLRTLYRYMEDSRIGSMRTASGRHRFTKDQILDFLNAGGLSESLNQAPVNTENSVNIASSFTPTPNISTQQDSVVSPTVPPVSANVVEPAPSIENENVNNLGNAIDDINDSYKSADNSAINLENSPAVDINDMNDDQVLENDPIVAENVAKPSVVTTPDIPNPFATVQQQTVVNEAKQPEVADITPPVEEALNVNTDLNVRYYKSEYSDLIRLAKKVSEIASAKDLEYAFSGHAGLSLHFLIKKTFTLLHFYANPEDMQIWREELSLTPVSKKEDSNIAIIVNTDIVFVPTKEMNGFKVVEDKVLLRDLTDRQELELARQFKMHLAGLTA